MRIDLWTARVDRGLGRKEVATALDVSPELIYAWEHYEREVPLCFGVQLAELYRKSMDDIAWGREESDMTIASRFLRVSPKTLRQMLKQGLYGIATPGTRERLIYIIDWRAVEYGLCYRRSQQVSE